MKYMNYIFDLYGTLVDINTDEDMDSLWTSMCDFYNSIGALYTKEELKMWYHKICKEDTITLRNRISDVTKQAITHEEINILKVFQRMYAKKGITPSLELTTQTARLFRTLSTKYIRLYPGTVEFLEEIKRNGGRIYLLSNAQESFTKPELIQLGLLPYFDDTFLSSDYEHKKPDVVFFHTLMDKHKMEKSQTIMIGNDLTSDIYGAHSVGIDSLYMHTNISPTYSKEEEKLYELPTYTVMDATIQKVRDTLFT